MENINDIYNFVQFELNKNQSGNTLNQDEFNLACAWANLEYFKFNFGLPEAYKVGSPSAPINYENTQLITDRLRKFKQFKGGRDLPSLPVDVNGQALYPSDYVHYSSIRYGTKDVTPVRDANLGSALNNSITAPDKTYPIMVFYDTYMQYYPTDLAFVDFTYLRTPATPFWAITIVNDAYVYDSLRSTQFEWGQENLTDIANLILGYAARNLKDQLNMQGSEKRKIDGI